MIRIRWRIQKILHWKWDRAVSNFFEALYKILFGRLYFTTLKDIAVVVAVDVLGELGVYISCFKLSAKGGLHFISECQQSAIT